jgi:membrane-bound metal-dependent hydrolase YbcI (DUF457 family)
MPFAFVHLIGAWLIGLIFEKFSRKLNRLEWALLLFGGILPDIDYLLQWIFDIHIHRVVSHSLLFGILVASLVMIITALLKKKYSFLNPRNCAIAIFVGVCTHLILDMIYRGGVPLFWPYEVWISYFGISYEHFAIEETYEMYKLLFKGAVLDMGIGITWLGWLYFRKKIEF